VVLLDAVPVGVAVWTISRRLLRGHGGRRGDGGRRGKGG